MNYNNRTFVAVANTDNGEVSAQTVFIYRQEGDVVWAEYTGGEIIKGFLLGTATFNGHLSFSYHHLNNKKSIRIGKCESIPEMLPDGRIRLHERWQWLNGDCSCGTSIVEEVGA